MFKIIENILTEDEAAIIYNDLVGLDWKKGHTRNEQYGNQVKKNLELRKNDTTESYKHIKFIEQKLQNNKEFQQFAFPFKQVTPRFNKCTNNGCYGKHADAAIMNNPPIRSDLSMTLFLTPPENYTGGELSLNSIDGQNLIYKGKVGTAVLYPSYYVHEVKPVTEGTRIACILWIQSMIRDEAQRALMTRLLAFGEKIQEINECGELTTEVSSIYNNLLRMWAEN